jgi:hypothetical protein
VLRLLFSEAILFLPTSHAQDVSSKDISPGTGSSSPIYLANVGGTFFFWANDGSNGSEF